MCVRRVCTILRAKTVDEGLFFLVVLTGKRIGWTDFLISFSLVDSSFHPISHTAVTCHFQLFSLSLYRRRWEHLGMSGRVWWSYLLVCCHLYCSDHGSILYYYYYYCYDYHCRCDCCYHYIYISYTYHCTRRRRVTATDISHNNIFNANIALVPTIYYRDRPPPSFHYYTRNIL